MSRSNPMHHPMHNDGQEPEEPEEIPNVPQAPGEPPPAEGIPF